MCPHSELVAARRRDFEQRAAAHRLAASLPKCRRRRTAAAIDFVERALHHQPRRSIVICGA